VYTNAASRDELGTVAHSGARENIALEIVRYVVKKCVKPDTRHPMIFKIVEREAWRAACRDGLYRGSADDVRDGFIHLSAAHQVRGTAAKHFKGVADLLLIAVDETALGNTLVWEKSRGGDLFPHLYDFLPTARALWEKPLTLDGEGVPIIPADVAAC
jgi:uncharacterized protein (DUF952 family)